MDAESVKKYIGKRCVIVLKNNYVYTAVIPPMTDWTGSAFTITDKFGKSAEVDCDMIGFIQEERGNSN